MVKKKKFIALLVSTVLIFNLAGCGNTEGKQEVKPEMETSAESGKQVEISDETTRQTETQASDIEGNRILIAYFSAGENSEVDVVSSASVTVIDGEAKGRLRVVADMIQAETGGDIFSIQTSVEYPGDGGELIDYAAVEQDENVRPELTSHIENLDDYDIIFIGYPNWWADMPMVMYSFFDEYDFSGKTIIPFNVHNGSRFSGTIETIQELEPNAEVITDGFTVSERIVAEAAGDVEDWLKGLGIPLSKDVGKSEVEKAQEERGETMADSRKNNLSGTVPDELEYIPSEYRYPAQQAGTLEKLTYQTWESFSYEEHTQELTKEAWVYLPYGYSEEQKYNVFYLSHGGWSNETTVMGIDQNPSSFKYVIDHAIEDGEIQPLIIVLPTYNNTSRSDSGDYSLALKLTDQFHNELLNDLLPAVEGKYSTYAEDTTPEGLAASRDHRGFGGFCKRIRTYMG